MFNLLIGYLFLFIFRPYEYWPILGAFHLERVYMIVFLIFVFLSKEKKYISHPINKYVFLFFMALVVSAFVSLDRTSAYNHTFDYFKIIILYFLIILSIRDDKVLKNFFIAYIVIMFLYVGKSFWEFFVHDRYIYRMGIKRMIGIDNSYGDSNAFAASIVYSLPFLWALIKYQLENLWLRKLLWLYGLLSVICIVYTGSRSGMVNAILFLILAGFKISKKTISIISVITLLILIWNFMPDTYQTRFMTVFQPGVNRSADASASGRTYSLKRGFDMFKKFPLLGVGPGNFPNGLSYLGDRSHMSSHNLYGLLLGETGLVGTLAFGVLVITILLTQKRIMEAAKDEEYKLFKLISIAGIQGIILLLFNGNFGGNLYRYNWLWIGATTVLSFCFLNRNKQHEKVII